MSERADTRHLVDPQLLPLLDLLPPVRLDGQGLEQTRAIFRTSAARGFGEAISGGVARSEVIVPASPAVRVLVYRPETAAGALPAIIHAHSGGYMLGSPEGREGANRHWCASLGCVVVSVDYRLAPEAPYPAAIEDMVVVLDWMQSSAETLSIDPSRIVAMGESAGGGLCAGLALKARGRLAGQMLAYPMLDDRTGINAPGPQGQFVWTRENNVAAWDAVLNGHDAEPYVAPARANDLSGLPPAAILVGDLDLFLAEDIAYATRLAEAGVPIAVHVYPGAFHAFDAMVSANVAQRFRRDVEHALKRMMRK
ncbi:MAG: alpha/beta hydrolase [Pseudomonadota bacterium]